MKSPIDTLSAIAALDFFLQGNEETGQHAGDASYFRELRVVMERRRASRDDENGQWTGDNIVNTSQPSAARNTLRCHAATIMPSEGEIGGRRFGGGGRASVVFCVLLKPCQHIK